MPGTGRVGPPALSPRARLGILETLLAAEGAVVSAEELLEHVWDAIADLFITSSR